MVSWMYLLMGLSNKAQRDGYTSLPCPFCCMIFLFFLCMCSFFAKVLVEFSEGGKLSFVILLKFILINVIKSYSNIFCSIVRIWGRGLQNSGFNVVFKYYFYLFCFVYLYIKFETAHLIHRVTLSNVQLKHINYINIIVQLGQLKQEKIN